MSVVKDCPGLYCGRTELGNDQWGGCGACPRGYRTNRTSYCTPCTDEPTLYDWQYLGLMVCLPLFTEYIISLVLNLTWFCNDKVTFSDGGKLIQLIQHMCTFLEIALGTVLALLALPPAGTLKFYVCALKTLSEWDWPRDVFCCYNTQLDIKKKQHCMQEPDYPLYTLILLIYTISFMLTITLRPLILHCLGFRSGMKAIYYAMFFYPVLVLTHTVAAGYIYCYYPYILFLISFITSFFLFLIVIPILSKPAPLWSTLTDTRTLIVIIANWLMVAYGLMALSGFEELWILSAAPASTLIFFVLSQMRNPIRFINDNEWVLDLD